MSNPSFVLLEVDPTTWGNPPVGKTYIGINESGQIVTKGHDGVPVVVESGATSLNKQANSDGSPITVTAGSSAHREVITLTGTARTQALLLAETEFTDGAAAVILLNLPATAGIVVEVYSDATLIWAYTNDTGAPIKASIEVYKDGSGWMPLRENIPSFNPA